MSFALVRLYKSDAVSLMVPCHVVAFATSPVPLRCLVMPLVAGPRQEKAKVVTTVKKRWETRGLMIGAWPD